jgi:hypothetical protein
MYLQLVEIEQVFKELKSDLSIRPIYRQRDERIEAHIFIAFLAYCLQVTLKQRLKALAGGLTPRAVLEKFAAMQMIDVELPTTDGPLIVFIALHGAGIMLSATLCCELRPKTAPRPKALARFCLT